MKEEESSRQLSELDTTWLAEPLLTEVKKDEEGSALHHVIIELNLLSHTGLSELNSRVRTRIKRMTARIKVAPGEEDHKPYLYDGKSELACQYVFANLFSRHLHSLLAWSEAEARVGGWASRPIYKIWKDFALDLYLDKSVSTVKADAARISFGATGEEIVWAVVDTGVANHRHFEKHRNLEIGHLGLTHWDFTTAEPKALSVDELVDEVGHGTHVAGIIAGEIEAEGEKAVEAVVYAKDVKGGAESKTRTYKRLSGVAPRCKILSVKAAGPGAKKSKHGQTRDIIAALAKVRVINGDGSIQRIHGVNISLGHDFDPRWFACGQSPLCNAVDQLVRSGVSVVVAAGNGGYGTLETEFKGEMYAGLEGTIRDPGNASMAITVGATHREMPHLYGVSYFSAKGPTGDGRLKPDLVAPGEKVVSCDAKGGGYVEMSGTSMAAPHVSGCIAAFLSLRGEFRRNPERIKEIFLANATDLGRERYYQGHGLVDLMRAIQAV